MEKIFIRNQNLKYLLLISIIYSTTIMSSEVEVSKIYQDAICKFILKSDQKDDADRVEFIDCSKGKFSTNSEMSRGSHKIFSYLGVNDQGKVACQISFNSKLVTLSESVCINLFTDKWPENK